MTAEPRTFLESLFREAIAAADPKLCVPPHLPPAPAGRTLVVGAGKAGAAMASAVEANWPGDLSGLVITRYGHGLACERIEIVEAAHPVPDDAGLRAAQRIAELVAGLQAEDLVMCLISGGGSALLTAPAAGLTLEDKREVNRQLLACGAPISEMNCLRKHLSSLKGGRLAAAAHPARVVSLIISDVPGDDPSIVASGPTAPDPTTRQDALAIVEKRKLKLPTAVLRFLESPEAETPKPGDARLANVENRMIATPAQSLAAAARLAEQAGYAVLDLGDRVEGEAREVACDQAGVALAIAAGRHAMRAPAVVLSGGETTVTMRGNGRGGRNAEYGLALALALDGNRRIWAVAGDTDGIDGSEDNAGALVAPDTLARARNAGIDAAARLADNDAYGFFGALGDLVVTGPTLTNVNDFRAILIESA
ncbi:MAG TPA: glycerate kinase [Aestuariivirgaceae bacterium]|nr:glycerate kinase [Aestuariivirgaceae bacterium]